MQNPRIKIWLVCLCVLIGCDAEPTELCEPQLGGIGVYATPLANQDPDRDVVAAFYNGAAASACAATATPPPTPDGTQVTARAGGILNLDHNAADQSLQAVAVGDDSLAVGWVQAGELWYATAHGGNSLKPTQFVAGEQIALAYSDVDRLHITWEQAGRIYYAAADDGDTVTDAPSEVGIGRKPHIFIDDGGWTHILFTNSAGYFQHQRDAGNGNWEGVTGPPPLGFWEGKYLTLIAVPDNPATISADGAVFASSQGDDNTIRVYRLDKPRSVFPQWQQVGSWHIPLTEQFSGNIQLDAIRTESGEIAVVTTWVTKPLALPAPFLELRQPRFFAVNPYAPNGVANGEYIHDGLNAVGWETTEYAHNAGLMQTFATTVGEIVQVSGWAKAWSSESYDTPMNPANMRMQIGLDPTAGRNPNAATVVWSASHSPTTTDWQEVTLQLSATGSQMTLFLRSRPNAARARSSAYWDDIRITNGAVSNPSFEAPFAPMPSDPDSQLPDQWEPFWEENANNAPPRQPYTAYAVISTDGGNSWSSPQIVMSNQLPAQGTTGALEDGMHPHILPQGQGVSFQHIFAHGDPAKEYERRFGRIHTTHCKLTLTDCTDPPGNPLLERTVLRPVTQLITARDPLDDTRTLALWQMIQTDHEQYDVLGTWIDLE